jgi:hypothetical protein
MLHSEEAFRYNQFAIPIKVRVPILQQHQKIKIAVATATHIGEPPTPSASGLQAVSEDQNSVRRVTLILWVESEVLSRAQAEILVSVHLFSASSYFIADQVFSRRYTNG